MKSTAEITYAANLATTIQSWIGEWKAMLPATPQGEAVSARIDAAMKWMQQ